jgi:hypothetical protein
LTSGDLDDGAFAHLAAAKLLLAGAEQASDSANPASIQRACLSARPVLLRVGACNNDGACNKYGACNNGAAITTASVFDHMVKQRSKRRA